MILGWSCTALHYFDTFDELHRLLFVLVELVGVLGFDLLECVDLTGGVMDHLVDLGVLFAGAQQLDLLEVALAE
jgi:hypothetical protein